MVYFLHCFSLKGNVILYHFYRPKRSFGQGNIFTPVCHSVHRGGREYLTRYPPPPRDQVHPPRDQVHPPGTRYTPPGTRYTPPGPGTPPWGQVHPPGTRYTPPPRTRYTPPAPGTPPPGCKLRNTVNDRPVRILLECILVQNIYCQEVLNDI